MRLLARVGHLWRRSRLDREFDEELLFHMDMRVERNVRRGMTRDQAETEARRHMGSRLRAREGMHEARMLPWLESFGRDLWHGARGLARQRLCKRAAISDLPMVRTRRHWSSSTSAPRGDCGPGKRPSVNGSRSGD